MTTLHTSGRSCGPRQAFLQMCIRLYTAMLRPLQSFRLLNALCPMSSGPSGGGHFGAK